VTYRPAEDPPEEPAGRIVYPVADLGDWTPDYGPDGRAESALDDPDSLSLQVEKKSATFLVPQALLEDYADSGNLGELLVKALSGEIELKPPPPPKRHRCIACWLVSLLPGHDRCRHGYFGCDECESDW
jgi:hypothetical protein